MDKKEFLYFEEDDSSEIGANGKQVFVTKRINGKTERNKIKYQKESETENLEPKELNKDNDLDEIILGIDRIYIPENNKKTSNSKTKEKNISKKHNTKTKKNNNRTKNNSKNSRKNKKKKKGIGKFLVILFLITITIIFAFVSPIFNIEYIKVEGNEKISTDTIVSLSKLQIGNNIFKNLKKDIIKNIKENPYIENIKVTRQLPNTITIAVEERSIEYQVKIVDSYVYLDYKGYILEKSSKKENVPFVEGFVTTQDDYLNNKRISQEDISYLTTMKKIIENAKKINIYNNITSIKVENGEFILYLKNEKKYIYLGSGSNITTRMQYIQTILKNEKDHSGKIMINGDLDNGFKPYFREEKIK